jgi:hypothetical protein
MISMQPPPCRELVSLQVGPCDQPAPLERSNPRGLERGWDQHTCAPCPTHVITPCCDTIRLSPKAPHAHHNGHERLVLASQSMLYVLCRLQHATLQSYILASEVVEFAAHLHTTSLVPSGVACWALSEDGDLRCEPYSAAEASCFASSCTHIDPV